MSELKSTPKNENNIRWRLLATASALALAGVLHGAGQALAAEDDEKPQLWIELGGRLTRLDVSQQLFSPSLMADRPSIFQPSQPLEKPPLYSIDEFGKIEFQPHGTDWMFSASVLYGRSSRNQHEHQQTNPKPFLNYIGTYLAGTEFPLAAKLADTNVKNSESHLILDFQAGKDVGLGMFGIGGGSSIVNFGVRFAQFSSKSNISLKSDPDWHFSYKYIAAYKLVTGSGLYYHSNAAQLHASSSFHGVGPSVSWNASAPVLGSADHGEVTLDWGANAALLFGRQKAKTAHQTTARYHPGTVGQTNRGFIVTQTSTAHSRSRSLVVPNVGGFAGVSFRYSNAKLSFGYRGDFFFGAMDGGIDVRKSENIGFNGPYASLSIGFGG